MGAKLSAETIRAMQLVDGGMAIYKAAVMAGVYPSTVYKALERRRNSPPKKRVDRAKGIMR